MGIKSKGDGTLDGKTHHATKHVYDLRFLPVLRANFPVATFRKGKVSPHMNQLFEFGRFILCDSKCDSDEKKC